VSDVLGKSSSSILLVLFLGAQRFRIEDETSPRRKSHSLTCTVAPYLIKAFASGCAKHGIAFAISMAQSLVTHATPAMPTLRIHRPETGAVTHELSGNRITVGRRPDNTIQIIDRSVSAHHAEFIFVDGHYRLHDLESTNLTFVEGAAITDYHLLGKTKLSFGTVQCEFDNSTTLETRLSPVQMETDMAFLRAENMELHAKIEGLERRINILNSARLVTGRTETTPAAHSTEAVRALTAERDDLRHQNAGLKLEIDKLRDQVDASRHEIELKEAQRAMLDRQVDRYRAQSEKGGTGPIELPPDAPSRNSNPDIGSGAARALAVPVTTASSPASLASSAAPATLSHVAFAESPSVIADAASTQKIVLLPGPWQAVPALLDPVRKLLSHLMVNESDSEALMELADHSKRLAESAASQREHPVGRLILWMDALLQSRLAYSLPPFPASIGTLDRAAQFLVRVLDPRLLDRAKSFPMPSVLAIDDDPDLLATLHSALESANFAAAEASEAEKGREMAGGKSFDLILLDHHLGGVDSQALAAQIRNTSPCGKTPIIVMTDTNGAGIEGSPLFACSSDFIAKPFQTAELIVKGQTWSLQSQFGML
jgi:two-component system, chemotaxis family, chemotaxis protein CheY